MAIASDLYIGTTFLASAMGLLEAAFAVGWIVGPVLGGLAGTASFTLPFVIASALGLACMPVPFMIGNCAHLRPMLLAAPLLSDSADGVIT
jgi:MFS family permease